MNKKPRLTLLRHYEEGETIDAGAEAIARMSTDAEVEAAYRQPGRWSYVVRDPDGAIPISGEEDTQQACLNRALDQVVDHASEACTFGEEITLVGWRFLLWPPEKR